MQRGDDGGPARWLGGPCGRWRGPIAVPSHGPPLPAVASAARLASRTGRAGLAGAAAIGAAVTGTDATGPAETGTAAAGAPAIGATTTFVPSASSAAVHADCARDATTSTAAARAWDDEFRALRATGIRAAAIETGAGTGCGFLVIPRSLSCAARIRDRLGNAPPLRTTQARSERACATRQPARVGCAHDRSWVERRDRAARLRRRENRGGRSSTRARTARALTARAQMGAIERFALGQCRPLGPCEPPTLRGDWRVGHGFPRGLSRSCDPETRRRGSLSRADQRATSLAGADHALHPSPRPHTPRAPPPLRRSTETAAGASRKSTPPCPQLPLSIWRRMWRAGDHSAASAKFRHMLQQDDSIAKNGVAARSERTRPAAQLRDASSTVPVPMIDSSPS